MLIRVRRRGEEGVGGVCATKRADSTVIRVHVKIRPKSFPAHDSRWSQGLVF